MKKLSLLIFMTLTGLSVCFAQADAANFGKISIQFNDDTPQIYYAKNATLYRNVSVDYDTTLQVQGEKATQRYYYSQLSKGKHYVLHLILDAEQSVLGKGITPGYDVYFDLGDTLTDPLQITDVDSQVFFYKDGEFSMEKYYSRNQSGVFSLPSGEEGLGISGRFSTVFEFPSPNQPESFDRISFEGDLNIPGENLYRGREGGISRVSPQKGKVVRNLLIAAALAGVILISVLVPN